MSYTTDRNDPVLGKGVDSEKTEQHSKYLILSEEERAKGFVRPVRETYVHVGRKVEREEGEIISLEEGAKDLSDYGKSLYTPETGYAAFLKYPESRSPVTGRFLTKEELESMEKGSSKGCGTKTTMSLPIAETYAREPKFYGSTYCVYCQKHLAVDEFVWDDTDIRVGE